MGKINDPKIDDARLKNLIKEAIEDIALAKAIGEGERSEPIARAEILKLLTAKS